MGGEALGQVAQEEMWKRSLNTVGYTQTSTGRGPSLSVTLHLGSFPSRGQANIIFSGFVMSNSPFLVLVS